MKNRERNLRIENGNKSPKRKGERKVQKEMGNKSPNGIWWKVNEQNEKKTIPKTMI